MRHGDDPRPFRVHELMMTPLRPTQPPSSSPQESNHFLAAHRVYEYTLTEHRQPNL